MLQITPTAKIIIKNFLTAFWEEKREHMLLMLLLYIVLL